MYIWNLGMVVVEYAVRSRGTWYMRLFAELPRKTNDSDYPVPIIVLIRKILPFVKR